jgi:hypothetical protein
MGLIAMNFCKEKRNDFLFNFSFLGEDVHERVKSWKTEQEISALR